MILWTIKQLNSIRLAIAGRQHPSQLAWGVAFGVLLGVVPHGNLLAVLLLLIVLSLKLNHAMAGLTAVSVTFGASYLDPYSHWVGHHLLTHPEAGRWAVRAWQYPLVPWTDLNNTVVLGSLSIGLAMLAPTFLLTYPIFRWLAPRRERETLPPDPAANSMPVPADARRIVTLDDGHRQIAKPHISGTPASADTATSLRFDHLSGPAQPADKVKRPAGPTTTGSPVPGPSSSGPVSNVGSDSRGVDAEDRESPSSEDFIPVGADRTAEPQFEEALRFLLHQLRDSQPRDAA